MKHQSGIPLNCDLYAKIYVHIADSFDKLIKILYQQRNMGIFAEQSVSLTEDGIL